MKIYEIDAALEALVDPETGELSDYAAFEALQMEREAKLEGMALYYKNLTAEAAAIRAEEIHLADRRRVIERKADGLKSYLYLLLGGEKFQTARCSVSYRNTKKVSISDMRTVAEWCENNGFGDLVAYNEPTISKTDLGRLLKNGVSIPGAELVESLSMGVK